MFMEKTLYNAVDGPSILNAKIPGSYFRRRDKSIGAPDATRGFQRACVKGVACHPPRLTLVLALSKQLDLAEDH